MSPQLQLSHSHLSRYRQHQVHQHHDSDRSFTAANLVTVRHIPVRVLTMKIHVNCFGLQNQLIDQGRDQVSVRGFRLKMLPVQLLR